MRGAVPTDRASVQARPLSATDVELVRVATLGNLNWTGEQRFGEEDLQLPEFSHYLHVRGERGDFGFVAEQAGDWRGVVWVLFLDHTDPGFGFVGDDVPELCIFVRADFRSQGIGRVLMSRALTEARQRGLTTVSLSVEEGNPAVVLYRSSGFEPVPDAAEGTMICTLSPRAP